LYTLDLSELEPREALVEAVRRLDPTYYNPDAMVLMGNFAGEAIRTPELLEILRKHAVEPRVSLVENVLAQLWERGAVRDGLDRHTIATLCFGSYFAAFYRKESRRGSPRRSSRCCGRRSQVAACQFPTPERSSRRRGPRRAG